MLNWHCRPCCNSSFFPSVSPFPVSSVIPRVSLSPCLCFVSLCWRGRGLLPSLPWLLALHITSTCLQSTNQRTCLSSVHPHAVYLIRLSNHLSPDCCSTTVVVTRSGCLEIPSVSILFCSNAKDTWQAIQNITGYKSMRSHHVWGDVAWWAEHLLCSLWSPQQRVSCQVYSSYRCPAAVSIHCGRKKNPDESEYK